MSSVVNPLTARGLVSDKKPIKLTAANFDGNTKLRAPADFMDEWFEREAAKKAALKPLRAIIFKEVPGWANLSDVLCLVYGGPIERIWSEGPNEVIVCFLYAADCEFYYNAVCGGIRLGDHLIEVVRAHAEHLTHEVKRCIDNGTTRVVQVHVPNDKTLQDLEDIVKTLDLDHLEYHNEPNKPGRVFFFFSKLIDGNHMMLKLMKREWMNCQAQYINDPCETVDGFHANSIAASPLASATVESVREE